VSTDEIAPRAPWSGFSMDWLTRSPNAVMDSACFRSASSASFAALAASDSRATFSSTAIIFSYERVMASMAWGSLEYRWRAGHAAR